MPFSLNFYHDQIGADGATASPLAPACRLLYVRHGKVEIDGQVMAGDAAIYCDGPVAMKSAGEWSQIWRWELMPPNAAPALLEGEGVLSSLRMARVIAGLGILEGTRWLFRLDQITSAAVSRYHGAHRGWLERGLYLPPSAYEVSFLSVAHTTQHLDQLLDALDQVPAKA